MKASRSQEKAINWILDKAVQHLLASKIHLGNQAEFNRPYQEFVNLKAPTGSGKTFMMFEFIKRLREKFLNNSEIRLIFVVCTVASSDLPGQIYRKFNEYKGHDNEIEIEHIQSPTAQAKSRKISEQDFTIKAKRNKIYILSGASFRANTIMKEQNVFYSFKNQISNQKYRLIYIRDEAHIGDSDSSKKDADFLKFEDDIQKTATFILKMTATPENFSNLYEISDQDLLHDEPLLIKARLNFNQGFEENQEVNSEIILKTACQKFKKIKESYRENQELKSIYPAMLIQVENKTEKKAEEFNVQIQKITEIIKEEGLTYFKYFGENDIDSNLKGFKNWKLADVSNNLSPIDVIIFKVGPATGWDIPRACMLVQLREVSSKNLTIQTLGRIKRNPNPALIKNAKLVHPGLEYYVYSNKKDNKIQGFELKTYTLKNENKSIKIIVGEHQLPKNLAENGQFLTSDSAFLSDYNNKVLQILSNFINCEYKKKSENNFEKQNVIQIAETESHLFFLESTFFEKEKYKNSGIYSIFEQKVDQWLNSKNPNRYISGFFRNYGESQQQADYEIYNLLGLKEIVLELKNKYQNLLNDYLINRIETEFYSKIISKIKVDREKIYTISLNMFWFLFLDKNIAKISTLFRQTLEKVKNQKLTYKIKKVKLPYEQVYKFESETENNKNKKKGEKIAKIDEFFTYEYTKKSGKIAENENNIPLDSRNEVEFLKILKKYSKNIKPPLKSTEFFWTKPHINEENPSLDYFDNEDGSLKKIYPDFIIGKRNKNNDFDVSHQFFIEIKDSESDINPEKTKLILDSFLDFFIGYRNYQKNQINTPHVSAMVCYVSEVNNENLECYGYSTIESLNKIISQKSIVEIDKCASDRETFYESCRLERLSKNSEDSKNSRAKHFINLKNLFSVS